MSVEACFRIVDPEAERITREVLERYEERLAKGAFAEGEIEKVRAAAPRRFEGPAMVSEAFRNCCIAWEVGRPAPITSHRRLAGLVLVPFKRALARLLRFQTEGPLARQSEFNRNLLIVIADLHARGDAAGDAGDPEDPDDAGDSSSKGRA